MANSGPSGICTVLGGALETVALGALGLALALEAAEAAGAGSVLAGDLQPHAAAANPKTSTNRAEHACMEPPRRETSSTWQTCPTSESRSWNLTAARERDKTAGS